MVTIVAVLLGLVALVAVISGILALQQRLPLRIALRNVRRGRGRTVLVILGLLIATTIISGSLVIGDTVNAVSVHFTYEAIGFTDEAVYNLSPSIGYIPFPYSVYTAVAAGSVGDPQIAGVTPEVIGTVQAFDQTSHVPQPGLNLIGADSNASGVLGQFTADNGTKLAGPGPGHAYVDDVAAGDVNASVGDQLVLYGSAVVPVTIAGIVQDQGRGDFLSGSDVFVSLSTAELLQNASGMINFLSVTNVGTQAAGVGLSDSVSAHLNATLAQLHPEYGLQVHELLADFLAQAETAGSSLTELFLVLGLFSIVAGAMLIVGIFVVLAEERKGEAGMLRAIGLRRRQLVYTYYFEGLVYSAGSAAAGSALGVAVGYALTYALAQLFGAGGAGGASSQAILDSFTVTSQSLVIAYVVGFLLTLGTVIFASSRASRLNIVRAIRSIPEPPPPLKTYTFLAYAGGALAVLGALLLAATASGTGDEGVPLLGGAMLIAGVALVLSRFLRNRIIFTAAGIALVAWAGIEPLRRFVLGNAHSGTIFSLFLLGILMIFGAILIYVFNSDLVVAGVSRLAGRNPTRISVARIGLSYPGRRSFRTAINLAIFSLVLFTIVAVASFGSGVQANLSSTITAESGGYTLYGSSTDPIPDLAGALANNSTLAPLYSNAVSFIAGGTLLTVPNGGPAFGYGIFAAPLGGPAADDFYTTNQYNFTTTLNGMSAASVFQELGTNSSVAVLDGNFNQGFTNFGSSFPSVGAGSSIAVLNPDTGVHRNLTVIGVLSETFINGVFVAPATASALGYHNETGFLLTVANGQSAVRAAQLTKSAFFAQGLILYDFAQVLQQSIQSTEAIIGLLEIFVALGLAVGIAAMGIVALRAVAERRGEIGMLRATGFTRRMVLGAFLLEYSYVALLGIGIGTGLAILLIYDASQSSAGVISFYIPWGNIATVIGVSYLLTVLAVLGPSLKAARLPPAEAIRYSE